MVAKPNSWWLSLKRYPGHVLVVSWWWLAVEKFRGADHKHNPLPDHPVTSYYTSYMKIMHTKQILVGVDRFRVLAQVKPTAVHGQVTTFYYFLHSNGGRHHPTVHCQKKLVVGGGWLP